MQHNSKGYLVRFFIEKLTVSNMAGEREGMSPVFRGRVCGSEQDQGDRLPGEISKQPGKQADRHQKRSGRTRGRGRKAEVITRAETDEQVKGRQSRQREISPDKRAGETCMTRRTIWQ